MKRGFIGVHGEDAGAAHQRRGGSDAVPTTDVEYVAGRSPGIERELHG